MTKQTLVIISLIFLLFKSIVSYPSGAPSSTCNTLMPNHGYSSQSSPAPYVYNSIDTCYSPGSPLSISFSSQLSFTGLLLQVRQSDGLTPAQGTFSNFDSSRFQTLNCNGYKNSITHSSSSNKQSLAGLFIPSLSSQGNLFVKLTLVQSYSIFWTNTLSTVIPPCQLVSSSSSTVNQNNGDPFLPTLNQNSENPLSTSVSPIVDNSFSTTINKNGGNPLSTSVNQNEGNSVLITFNQNSGNPLSSYGNQNSVNPIATSVNPNDGNPLSTYDYKSGPGYSTTTMTLNNSSRVMPSTNTLLYYSESKFFSRLRKIKTTTTRKPSRRVKNRRDK